MKEKKTYYVIEPNGNCMFHYQVNADNLKHAKIAANYHRFFYGTTLFIDDKSHFLNSNNETVEDLKKTVIAYRDESGWHDLKNHDM